VSREAFWCYVRFPDEEYERRLARLREAMAAEAVDAVVLSDDRLTWYFTGFGDVGPIGSPARPRVLCVPAVGEPAFFVHRSTELCVQEMSAVADVRSYRPLGPAPVAEIVAFLRERGCRRVGVELGAQLRPGMMVEDIDGLRAAVPEPVDASRAVWAVRMVKSEAEIERIRAACRITDRAYERALPSLRAGMTEHAVAGLLRRTLGEEGADDAWAWVASGRGQYDRIDGVVRERTLARGDLVFVDMGACVGGYWADFSRACVIGRATPGQLRMQELVAEVTGIGVATLVAGRTAGEAAGLVGAAMNERGLEFSSRAERYGHGLGLAVTERPDVWQSDGTLIRPGMVLTMEPGTWTEEGMFHCEQNVLVTETGNEVLSLSSWRLTEVMAG
jgi:Xaa-Pro aminopeptidase